MRTFEAGGQFVALRPVAASCGVRFPSLLPGTVREVIIGVMAQAEQGNLPISLMSPSCLPDVTCLVRS